MESPLIKKSWNRSINTLDIVYPNLYYGGVYCLAPIIIYNIVNNLPSWLCNRSFLDKQNITSNLVGFTFQYELDYYNIPKIKTPTNSVLFAGGPCITQNPETLSKYFDFFLLGESEALLPKILQHYPSKDFFAQFLDKKDDRRIGQGKR